MMEAMMAIKLLTLDERAEYAAQLPGWTIDDNGKAMHRAYRFADFKAAFAFMTAVAEQAEAMDHHPDWRNVYNRVEVTLSTHEADGLTIRDIRLAQAMDVLI
jgi:4a-hydroxytetrahydrobiopterin dehydratase